MVLYLHVIPNTTETSFISCKYSSSFLLVSGIAWPVLCESGGLKESLAVHGLLSGRSTSYSRQPAVCAKPRWSRLLPLPSPWCRHGQRARRWGPGLSQRSLWQPGWVSSATTQMVWSTIPRWGYRWRGSSRRHTQSPGRNSLQSASQPLAARSGNPINQLAPARHTWRSLLQLLSLCGTVVCSGRQSPPSHWGRRTSSHWLILRTPVSHRSRMDHIDLGYS